MGEWPADPPSSPDIQGDDGVFEFVSGGEMNTNSYLFISGLALVAMCCFAVCIYRRRRDSDNRKLSMFSSIENGNPMDDPEMREIRDFEDEVPHSLVHNASVSIAQQQSVVAAAAHPHPVDPHEHHRYAQQRKRKRQKKSKKHGTHHKDSKHRKKREGHKSGMSLISGILGGNGRGDVQVLWSV